MWGPQDKAASRLPETLRGPAAAGTVQPGRSTCSDRKGGDGGTSGGRQGLPPLTFTPRTRNSARALLILVAAVRWSLAWAMTLTSRES